MKNEHIDVLRNSVIFKSLPDDIIMSFISNATIESFQKDTILLEMTDVSMNVYLVLKGKVKVSRFTKDREEAVLGFIETGNLTGELGVLGETIRSARVTCIEDTTVLNFSSNDFENIIRSNNTIAYNLLRELGDRIRSGNDNVVRQLEAQKTTLERKFLKLQRLTEASKVFN